MKTSTTNPWVVMPSRSAPSRPNAPAPAPSTPMVIGAWLRHPRLVKGRLIKESAEHLEVSIGLIPKNCDNEKLLPPLTVPHGLVTELETSIGSLFEPDWAGVGHISRAGGRSPISARGERDSVGVTPQRLAPNGKGHVLGGDIPIVAPGGGRMGSMCHEGDEVGHVLEGRSEPSIDATMHELGPGDSFSFPSNPAHAHRNTGQAVTGVIWVNTPPTC